MTSGAPPITADPALGANADHAVVVAAAARRERRGPGNPFAWLILILALMYFLVPLIGTFIHSIRTRPDIFLAYRQVFADPKFFGGLLYSFTVGVITIMLSLLLIVPTAYWVRLRVPRLRPVVEFVTLMPFVIPPVVLVFGLIRVYSSRPLVLTATDLGSDIVLVCAYVILSFPYMYRAVDTGLAAIDVRTLTEAAQSMGSGWATDPVAGHLPEPAHGTAVRSVPDPRHRHRRIHDRELPRPHRRVRAVPVAPRPQPAVSARGGVAHQLRADLGRDAPHRPRRPRRAPARPGRQAPDRMADA